MTSGVYIILDKSRSNDSHFVCKIGMSEKNIDNRIQQVIKSYSFNGFDKNNLEVLSIIKVRQARTLEKHLHQIFNSNKIKTNYKNEWFDLYSEDYMNEKIMKHINLEYYNR